MDIRNVAKSGGVERSSDRPARGESKRDDAAPYILPRDEASISATSREKAASVDGLANRARHSGEAREAKLEAARQKLANDELDGPAVVKATAQRLLATDFLSE